MSIEKLLILGDFNIHVDVPSDVHVRKLQDLFDCLGLEQHVRERVISDVRVTWERVSQKLNILTARRRGP